MNDFAKTTFSKAQKIDVKRTIYGNVIKGKKSSPMTCFFLFLMIWILYYIFYLPVSF